MAISNFCGYALYSFFTTTQPTKVGPSSLLGVYHSKLKLDFALFWIPNPKRNLFTFFDTVLVIAICCTGNLAVLKVSKK